MTLRMLAAAALLALLGGCFTFQNAEVRKNGAPGWAQILAIDPTNMAINDQPVCSFTLEVHPRAGAPYVVKDVREIIDVVYIPQFQPGAKVPVKIDRQDPQKVALDLEAPLEATEAAAAPPPEKAGAGVADVSPALCILVVERAAVREVEAGDGPPAEKLDEIASIADLCTDPGVVQTIDGLARNPPAQGRLVVVVMPKSQGAEAGFRTGDIIVSYDGKPLGPGTDVGRIAMDTPPERAVDVAVFRPSDGGQHVLRVHGGRVGIYGWNVPLTAADFSGGPASPGGSQVGSSR
jgi:hypothetical protein